jgi:uncharacterized protein YkwD
MRSLAVLALLAAAVAAPATSASAYEQTEMQPRAGLEAQIVRELNIARAAHGLRPVRSAPSLRTAARVHTRTMLDVGFFAHESPDGTAFSERVRRYYASRGWRTWSVGETLLASQGQELDAGGIVSAWLDSPPHRQIVLSPNWRDVGIGAFYAPSAPREFDGAQTLVVTGDFGLRSGKAPGS